MNGFIYQADLYCEDCGQAIRNELDKAGKAPDDPDDETTYDSDEYPKKVDVSEESDCPQHCGAANTCLNAIEVHGQLVGCWLENDLTSDGVEYVREAIRDNRGLVVDLWKEYYSYVLD